VEWVEQFGYEYGTSRKWVQETVQSGTDLVFDLDSRGARALKNDFPQSILIFILPPSLEELEKRLTNRGSLSSEELARRLENGRAELREARPISRLSSPPPAAAPAVSGPAWLPTLCSTIIDFP
jgi:guanylate kinase